MIICNNKSIHRIEEVEENKNDYKKRKEIGRKNETIILNFSSGNRFHIPFIFFYKRINGGARKRLYWIWSEMTVNESDNNNNKNRIILFYQFKFAIRFALHRIFFYRFQFSFFFLLLRSQSFFIGNGIRYWAIDFFCSINFLWEFWNVLKGKI